MEIPKIIIVLFVVLFAVSIIININNLKERDEARQRLINDIYCELSDISFSLEWLSNNAENRELNDKAVLNAVEAVVIRFKILDMILTQSRPRFNLNSYGTFDFDYISYTLSRGSGSSNGVRYESILYDDNISANEIRYLSILRNDIKHLVSALVSEKNPPRENSDLSIDELNTIFNDFFARWGTYDENSPYVLLRSE